MDRNCNYGIMLNNSKIESELQVATSLRRRQSTKMTKIVGEHDNRFMKNNQEGTRGCSRFGCAKSKILRKRHSTSFHRIEVEVMLASWRRRAITCSETRPRATAGPVQRTETLHRRAHLYCPMFFEYISKSWLIFGKL